MVSNDVACAASAAVIFPGQGSQSPAMVAAYSAHPQVAAAVAEAGAVLGVDLAALIADREALAQTINTQPALLAVCVGVFRAVQLNSVAFMAGHSLGEYAALVCAGAVDFADAVRLVRRRGQLMQQAATGGMAAVIGEVAAVDELCAAARQKGGRIWAANYNAPQQTVVAGDTAAIAACREWTAAAGIKKVLPLPVSIPSHCPLMQPAADLLAAELQALSWRPPSPPLIHNATLQSANSAVDICSALAAQLTRPVRWTEVIGKFAAAGIARIYECGPGGVLSGLARRMDGAPPHVSLADDAALQLSVACTAAPCP